MLETSARLLRLLSLLQTGREWSGTGLAGRLEVSARTVRRDVDRLRELGYPVRSVMGAGGGYRLEAGAELPPLLLDDEEAVAVAVSLRTAAGGSVSGLQETALRALAKLDRVLPRRLRGRVAALQEATVAIPDRDVAAVDPEVLSLLAAACRDQQRLRFDYTAHDGASAVRRVEPHRVVSWGSRWYLLAFDLDRDDWRTFRVDRLRPWTPVGPGFAPRDLPGGDAADFMERNMSAMWPYRARFRFHASAETMAPMVSPVDGVVEAVDEHSCLVTLAGSDPEVIAHYTAVFGVDFTLLEPEEVRVALRALADRICRSLDAA
jgi:predicted DNA-binding transcriptional regulator YafY